MLQIMVRHRSLPTIFWFWLVKNMLIFLKWLKKISYNWKKRPIFIIDWVLFTILSILTDQGNISYLQYCLVPRAIFCFLTCGCAQKLEKDPGNEVVKTIFPIKKIPELGILATKHSSFLYNFICYQKHVNMTTSSPRLIIGHGFISLPKSWGRGWQVKYHPKYA